VTGCQTPRRWTAESLRRSDTGGAGLAPEERNRMDRASRARAEVLFDVNTVVKHYLRILEAAAARKRVAVEHWPQEVPADIHA
jgi:hypothetical protein